MPKKNTKKLNIISLDQPLIKPFDMASNKDAARKISAFMALQQTEGWSLFVQMFTKNIDMLNEQIIDKEGLDGKPLTDEQVDALRNTRRIYKEMLELPTKTIEKLQVFDTEDIDDDPYGKDASEIASLIPEKP